MPVSAAEVELLVRQTIANRLRLDSECIQLETRLLDLNIDSLDMAEMLFLLEDQLGKAIHLEQSNDLATVNDVVDLVKKFI